MFVLIGEGWHVLVPVICLTMEPQLRHIVNAGHTIWSDNKL
jgi:hypothetical protein